MYPYKLSDLLIVADKVQVRDYFYYTEHPRYHTENELMREDMEAQHIYFVTAKKGNFITLHSFTNQTRVVHFDTIRQEQTWWILPLPEDAKRKCRMIA